MFGLKDLKWMRSFAKKAINSEKEKDTSIKGMMTLHLTHILLETFLNLHVFIYINFQNTEAKNLQPQWPAGLRL